MDTLAGVIETIGAEPESLERMLPADLPWILERAAFSCEDHSSLVEQLADLAKRSSDDATLALLASELAIYYMLRGEVDSAARYLTDLPDYDAGPRPARILLAHGWYAGATGQYVSALILLEQACAVRHDPLCAAVLYRMSCECGDNARARSLEPRFENLRDLPRAALFEYGDARAHSLRNAGEFRQCLAIRYRLWLHFRRGPAHLATASAGRLAFALCEAGQFNRARLAYLRVEERLKRFRQSGPCSAYIQNARRFVERRIRELADANPHSVSRIWRSPQTAPPPGVAPSSIRFSSSYAQWNLECSLWLADLRSDGNAFAALVDDYGRIFSTSESSEIAARTRGVVANGNDLQELLEVRNQFQDLNLVPDEIGALCRLFRLFPETVRSLKPRFEKLHRLVRLNLRRPLNQWAWDAALETVHDLIRLHQFGALGRDAVEPAPLFPVARFLTAYVRPEQELLHHLAETTPGMRPPTTLDPGRCGNALVFFCCSATVLRTFVLYRDQENCVRCFSTLGNSDRDTLRELIAEMIFNSQILVESKQSIALRRFGAKLRDIARTLRFDDLCASLPPYVSRIAIHPDAWTAPIPFAALPAQDGSPLVSRFCFSIQPILQREEARPSVPVVNIVVPALTGATGLPTLERLQALDLCSLLASHGGLAPHQRNPTANREWLRASLPEATHFLFIGHGNFDETPDRSRGLLLTSPPDPECFEACDLSTIRTPNLELVSLFCCWAGDSQPTPLSWSVGFADSFLRAGARNVIASLWPAGESFVKDFIPAFYRQLVGSCPERALSSAQLEMLARGWDANHWAGFVLRRRAAPEIF